MKEQIVADREFKNIRLQSEEVASFEYKPHRCEHSYRTVVVRKNLSVEKGERVLFDDIRYFFYITNDRRVSGSTVVFNCNGRCNQENLIQQLLNAVRALQRPVDNPVSNWAYLVLASLAWTLKAWFALSLPEHGRWGARYRVQKQAVLKMKFKSFLNAFLRVPVQLVRTGGKLLFRLLAWNPWHEVLLRAVDTLRGRRVCW